MFPERVLFAFPVFSGRSGDGGFFEPAGARGNNESPGGRGQSFGRGPPAENEWMIFELDTNYLRNTWLPDLTRRYLNPDAQPFNDVEIRTVLPPRTVIYSSPGAVANTAEVPVKVSFNRQGRDSEMHLGPGMDYCWELEVRPHLGAVEAVVDAARRRNLAVALLLNGLIFAAGFALLVHTRRSRQLAQAQMTFVANVSHELRTPLTVIRGAGHNLLRGVAREPGQIEQYSRLIIQHAEQLTNMVEQILGLAGARNNSSAASREPVNLAEVLREAVAATKQDTDAAHCEIHLELPPDLLPVLGEASALAPRFSKPDHQRRQAWRTRRVDWHYGGQRRKSADSPMIEIKVADRGAGNSKSRIDRNFQAVLSRRRRAGEANSRQRTRLEPGERNCRGARRHRFR